MAIKYTWDCSTVDTYPTASNDGVDFNDVVFLVHYRLTASDTFDGEEKEHPLIGTEELDISNLQTGSFVEFENISKDQVVGWVTASLGDEAVASLKQTASGSLLNVVTPPVVTKTIE